MSSFGITDFIESGRKSLEDKNYWSALSVALSLPSMCSRIAFADEKDKYMNFQWIDKHDHSKGKQYTTWKDKDCYIDFCNKIMWESGTNPFDVNTRKPDSWMEAMLGVEYAKTLYDLRCGILHSCAIQTNDHGICLQLLCGEHQTVYELSGCRVIPIVALCEHIFDCVSMWCPLRCSQDGTEYIDISKKPDLKMLDQKITDTRNKYLHEQKSGL